MDKLVTQFVENFLRNIKTLLSEQDAQIGNQIILKRLSKCKSRVVKACCPKGWFGNEKEGEEQEVLVCFHGDEHDGGPGSVPMINEETVPPPEARPNLSKDFFLNDMFSHILNMQTLVDNTLNSDYSKQPLCQGEVRSSEDKHTSLEMVLEEELNELDGAEISLSLNIENTTTSPAPDGSEAGLSSDMCCASPLPKFDEEEEEETPLLTKQRTTVESPNFDGNDIPILTFGDKITKSPESNEETSCDKTAREHIAPTPSIFRNYDGNLNACDETVKMLVCNV